MLKSLVRDELKDDDLLQFLLIGNASEPQKDLDCFQLVKDAPDASFEKKEFSSPQAGKHGELRLKEQANTDMIKASRYVANRFYDDVKKKTMKQLPIEAVAAPAVDIPEGNAISDRDSCIDLVLSILDKPSLSWDVPPWDTFCSELREQVWDCSPFCRAVLLKYTVYKCTKWREESLEEIQHFIAEMTSYRSVEDKHLRTAMHILGAHLADTKPKVAASLKNILELSSYLRSVCGDLNSVSNLDLMGKLSEARKKRSKSIREYNKNILRATQYSSPKKRQPTKDPEEKQRAKVRKLCGIEVPSDDEVSTAGADPLPPVGPQQQQQPQPQQQQ